MIKRYFFGFLSFSILSNGLLACSPSSNLVNQPVSPFLTASTPGVTPNNNLTQLFSRIWRVTQAPSQPASGSIYIFLPNGTLLETSCTETYRIATWTIDPTAPRVLRVVEDGQLAFTASIEELSDTTLRLRQDLVRSNEQRNLTLTAVEQEFVCPDLRLSP